MRKQALTLALLIAAMATAGCFGGDDPSPPAAATPTAEGDAATPEGERDAAGTNPAAPTVDALPVAWSGTLESGVRVCDPGTVGCETVRPGQEDQERLIEVGHGTIVAGQVNLTWSASSTLTEELRLVVRTEVPDCEDCEPLILAFVVGPSPIEAPLMPMERPLAEGEVVRVYVRADHAQYHEPYYAQADFTQSFDVDGQILVERPSAATA